MVLDLTTVKKECRYTVKEVCDILQKNEITVRNHIDVKLPEEYKVDQNKKGKFRKYLINGDGVKFLLGM